MGITTDHGRSFNQIEIPIGQMYHVAVDNQVPCWIYSNRQDDGTMRGPSDPPVPVPNVPSYRGDDRRRIGPRGRCGPRRPWPRRSRTRRHRRATPWQPNLGGCESGFTLPNPTNADIVWASCYGNEVDAGMRGPGARAVGQPRDGIRSTRRRRI